MAVFRYKAVSRDGAKVSGVVEGYDKFEAIGKIKETCSVVTSISEVAPMPALGKDLFGPPMIKDKSLALLSSQFSIILKTGLSVVRAVELIRDQTNDRQLKQLLEQVAFDVSAGYGLAQSLESKGGKILPTTFVETVRAGEESGTLVESFAKLHTYYDKSAKVRARVRSAMIYPVFLLILAACVIAIIMVVAMPTFISTFELLDIELPGMTKALIAMSRFFSQYWWLVAILLAALVLGFQAYAKSEKGGLRVDELLLKVPILGRMNQMNGASQFANTLSTLLAAGISLNRAAAVTAKVLDNRYLGRELGTLIPMLEEGKRLGEQMRRQKIFPAMLCEMVVMGEDTGSLESTLDTVGEYYDSEAMTASQRALEMLQPAITVVMGVIIGFIVIGLYLPMFALYAGM